VLSSNLSPRSVAGGKADDDAIPTGSLSSNNMNTPMRHTRVSCCARAASGQATALPSPAMKSRRLICNPHGFKNWGVEKSGA
jgi:hypothetical protein